MKSFQEFFNNYNSIFGCALILVGDRDENNEYISRKIIKYNGKRIDIELVKNDLEKYPEIFSIDDQFKNETGMYYSSLNLFDIVANETLQRLINEHYNDPTNLVNFFLTSIFENSPASIIFDTDYDATDLNKFIYLTSLGSAFGQGFGENVLFIVKSIIVTTIYETEYKYKSYNIKIITHNGTSYEFIEFIEKIKEFNRKGAGGEYWILFHEFIYDGNTIPCETKIQKAKQPFIEGAYDSISIRRANDFIVQQEIERDIIYKLKDYIEQ